MENTDIVRHRESHTDYVTGKGLIYTALVLISLASGVALFFVPPELVLLGVIGIIGAILVLKYQTVGLIFYLMIYFLRPGERYPSLAPLRVELVIGAMLLFSILFSNAFKGRGLIIPKDDISKKLAIFFGALLLSTLFSEWVSQSVEFVDEFFKTMILYYFLVALIDDDKKFKIIFLTMVTLLCFVSLEATIGYFQGDFRVNQGIYRIGGTTSFGEHANSMAMYAASTIPLLIYTMLIFKNRLIKVGALAFIILSLVTLVLTGSRSGILCMAASGFTFAWFSKKRLQLMIAIIVIGVSGWFMLPDMYKQRYSSMTNEEVDASTQGRFNAWKSGINMLIEKPLLGVGPGVFAAAYYSRDGVWLSSHSLYIEMLSTTGLIGTAAWLLFLLSMFIALRRFDKYEPKNSELLTKLPAFSLAMKAIFVGLLTAGIAGHILFRDTWYILAGFLAATYALIKKDAEIN